MYIIIQPIIVKRVLFYRLSAMVPKIRFFYCTLLCALIKCKLYAVAIECSHKNCHHKLELCDTTISVNHLRIYILQFSSLTIHTL